MRNRRYSESTIKNYSGGQGLFFRFTGNKNPEQITKEDLESFHKNYIISRKYSASFQSLVINAVKLYFSNRLKRKLEPTKIERPKQPRLLPHVLSKEEVKAILKAHQNVKHRAMLSLIYACGLRRGELLNLKLIATTFKGEWSASIRKKEPKTDWYRSVKKRSVCFGSIISTKSQKCICLRERSTAKGVSKKY